VGHDQGRPARQAVAIASRLWTAAAESSPEGGTATPLWLRRIAQATRSSQSGVAAAGSGLATAVHIAVLPRTVAAVVG